MEIITVIGREQVAKVAFLSKQKKKVELKTFIESLPQIAIAELALLIWKGRGDDITDDQYQLDFALDEVKDPGFIDYILAKPIHEYLAKTNW